MDWGEPIFKYTRAMALADGVLLDVSEAAQEAGFRYPVEVTQALWEGYIKTDLPHQDTSGRLWDVLFLLALEAKKSEGDTVLYTVSFLMEDDSHKDVRLKAVIEPGDDPSPVITIMLDYED